MAHPASKEHPKLALRSPKKKKLKGYLPVTITCKNVSHYLDAPVIDIVHLILENRGASGPLTPPPPKKKKKKTFL